MPVLKSATPILFVRDVPASAAFFRDTLGFAIDFLHGTPPFYGAVSRGGACLHLRFVHEPVFSDAVSREESLIVTPSRPTTCTRCSPSSRHAAPPSCRHRSSNLGVGPNSRSAISTAMPSRT